MKKLFLLFSILIFAVACSKNIFEQDPLANMSNEIRNGVPPEIGNRKAAKEPEGESLRIYPSSDTLIFKEGVTSEYYFTARSLIPNTDVEVRVDNIAQLEGAQFDAQTGKFTWAPKVGFTGDEYQRHTSITIVATTKGTVRRRVESYGIDVQRSSDGPTITRVEMDRSPMHEGDSRNIQVYVKDAVGKDATGARPILVIANRYSYWGEDISNLLVLSDTKPTLDPQDQTQWVFELSLKLNREITADSKSCNFNLRAVDRFGRPSADSSTNVTVRTNVGTPKFSMPSRIQMMAMMPNTFTFVVADPTGQGKLRVTHTNLDAAGPKMVCNASSDASQVCNVSWNPALTEVGRTRTLNFDAISASPVVGDSLSRSNSSTVDISVIAPPVPSPTPTPTTTPSPSATPKPTPSATPNEVR